MLKIISKFILFTVLLLFLIKISVINSNPYLKVKDDYSRNMEGFKSSNADFIILGDSMPASINGDLLPDNIYNLAFGSDGVNEMYIKLRYAIKHNPKIKAVLLNCGYRIFASDRKTINNKLFIKPFTDPIIFEELFEEKYNKDFIIDALSRFAIFNQNVYVFARRRIANTIMDLFLDPKFISSKSGKWEQLSNKQRIKKATLRISNSFKDILVPEFIETFDKIIQLCEENNIKVIGIRYPISQEYLTVASKYDLSKVDEVYESMRFEKFLDYSKFLDNSKYFIDPDHIYREGLIIFVNKLYKDLGIDYQLQEI